MGSGDELDHEPVLRAGDRASPQRRHQAGPHHRRLARSRRPDDAQEPRPRRRARPSARRAAGRASRARRSPRRRPRGTRGAPCTGSGARRRRRRRDAVPSSAARKAAASSSASSKRASGSFAVARAMTASTADGSSGRIRRDRGERLLEVLVEQAPERAPGERVLAREHLVQHDPERVDVRSGRERFEPDLLGGQVRGRAADHRSGRLLERAGSERDAEVRQVGVALLVEQDVGRLHVAVDDALPVRRRRAPTRCGRGSERRVRRRARRSSSRSSTVPPRRNRMMRYAASGSRQ